MKINQIVSSMSNGMARTNRFSVVMAMPSFLADDGITPFRNLLLFCDQATLPGLQVNTTPIRIFGEVRETPTEYNYEPITLSFYVDQQMQIKAWFDAWIKNLQYGNSRTFRYYDKYVCPQMQILVQNTLDQSVYQVNLYEAWPKSVGSIQLDYASKDIMKLSVTIQYKYWDYTTIDAPTGNTSLLMGDPQPRATGGTSPDAVQDIKNGVAQTLEPDINKIKQIPQQYFSDINSFQANAQKNIMSDLNAKMNEGLNSLRGTAQGALTDLWNAW
jgi:hypothetical protein